MTPEFSIWESVLERGDKEGCRKQWQTLKCAEREPRKANERGRGGAGGGGGEVKVPVAMGMDNGQFGVESNGGWPEYELLKFKRT